MKKIILVTFVALFAVQAMACDGKNKDKNPTTQEQTKK